MQLFAFTWSAEAFSVLLCTIYFLHKSYDGFPKQPYMGACTLWNLSLHR